MNLALKGGTLFEEVGDELLQRARVHDGAGDPVGSGGKPFVDHSDRSSRPEPCLQLALRLDEVGQMECACERGYPATHVEDIDFEDISLFECITASPPAA